MRLSDKDLELAKKHGFVDESYLMTKPVQTRLSINFTENNLAAFLAERDALTNKEKVDAVREALKKAVDTCETVRNHYLATGDYTASEEAFLCAATCDCQSAILALIEPKV